MSTPVIIAIILAAVLLLALLFFGILFWIYSFAFGRSHTDCAPEDGLDSEAMRPYADENRKRIMALLNEEYEDVYIESPLDKIRLHARLYHRREGAPIQIMCHGYRSNPYRDFSGGALEALGAGHNLLLIDQRAHLGSEGKTITFGIKERHDLLGWAEYIAARFPSSAIILVGISMGGATVVAASSLPMPAAVKCIVSDCPYGIVRDVLVSTAKKMHFPAFVYPLIRLSGKIFGGFDANDGDFTAHASKSRLPIIILHGEADRLVPEEMSALIERANPKMIRRLTFSGARHGISYLTDRDRYVDAVYSFIDEHTASAL